MGSSYPSDPYCVCQLSASSFTSFFELSSTDTFLYKDLNEAVEAKTVRFTVPMPTHGSVYTFGYGKHGQVCVLIHHCIALIRNFDD